MRTTNRGIIKLGLFAAGLALSLFALQGRQVASAAPGPSDLKVERTCEPNVFRPGEWVVHECLVKLTNTSDEPMPGISSAWKSASGVIPVHYWVLFEIDGAPLPIEPQALETPPAGVLQPGQSVDIRLVTLVKMPAEGIYDGTWPTLVDGEPVPGTEVNRFEAKADANLPAEDLAVRQISYRKGTQAVFNTTITNVSHSTITDLAFTERYGPETKLVDTSFTYTDSNINASIVQWRLASSDKKSLAPGESVKLQTVYESLYGGDVESGVLVEATVNGEKETYGDRADPVCTSCVTENSPPAVAPGSEGLDVPLVPPVPTGPQAVMPPNAGEGSSGDSEMALYGVLLTTAIGLTGTAIVVRRRPQR
jgi:hypothetical protein